MSSKLQAGVIGLGILGSQHAKLIDERTDIELAAVADLRQEQASALANETGAAPYTDYGEMLKEQSLDIIVIATPDPYHRDPALAAIEAGVPNLIMEKPLATTMVDAQRIADASNRRNTRILLNFANRAAPGDLATRWTIQNGVLGDVVYGEARLDDNISVPTGLWGKRSQAWASGSSTAHFLLSHVVDLMRFYFGGEITDVYAVTQAKVLGFTPDLYDAFLTMSTGQTIRIKAEWIKHMDRLVEFYLSFSGSGGTLVYNKLPGHGVTAGLGLTFAEDGLTQYEADRIAQGLGIIDVAPDIKSVPDYGHPHWQLSYEGDLTGEFMAMPGILLDAITEDTLTPTSWQDRGRVPSLTDGLRQTEVVAAIVHSAETGQPVSLS